MGSVPLGFDLKSAVFDFSREMSFHTSFYLVQHLEGVSIFITLFSYDDMG